MVCGASLISLPINRTLVRLMGMHPHLPQVHLKSAACLGQMHFALCRVLNMQRTRDVAQASRIEISTLSDNKAREVVGSLAACD